MAAYAIGLYKFREESALAEAEALADAANKEVTDAVVAAVDDLLGLNDEAESTTP